MAAVDVYTQEFVYVRTCVSACVHECLCVLACLCVYVRKRCVRLCQFRSVGNFVYQHEEGSFFAYHDRSGSESPDKRH